MCGVLGYISNKPDLDLLRKLIIESSIRGLHATGISYKAECGKILTFIHPGPAKEFLELFDLKKVLTSFGCAVIVHCRYSTSDLEYNQPIGNHNLSMVHNGVITQEPPEKWPDMFPDFGNFATKNDSEILWKAIVTDKFDSIEVMNPSIAACWLDASAPFLSVGVVRNGKRPLYKVSIDDEEGNVKGYIVVSTSDILSRADSSIEEVIKVSPGLKFISVIYRDGEDNRSKLTEFNLSRIAPDKEYCNE